MTTDQEIDWDKPVEYRQENTGEWIGVSETFMLKSGDRIIVLDDGHESFRRYPHTRECRKVRNKREVVYVSIHRSDRGKYRAYTWSTKEEAQEHRACQGPGSTLVKTVEVEV